MLCKDCITCHLSKPFPLEKQLAEKQDFKGQSLLSNHRISFDTKDPISPSSEGNSSIRVIVDALTHSYLYLTATLTMLTQYFTNTE